MSKVTSLSGQAARLEDRGGGREEWRLVMGEQSRPYTEKKTAVDRCPLPFSVRFDWLLPCFAMELNKKR